MDKRKHFRWFQVWRFFSFFRPHWKLILFSAVGIFLGVILQLPMPLVTRHLIDNILPNKNFMLLNYIILALLGVLIFQVISGVLTSYLSSLFRERVLNSFQLKLFEYILNLDLSFFQKYKTGYLLGRVESDIEHLRGLVADNLISILKDALTFLTGAVVIFIFYWKLALLSTVILPFFIISLKYFSKRIRKYSGEARECSAQVMSFLQEFFSGILVVKAFQLEKSGIEKLTEKQSERIRVNVKSNLISSISSYIAAFIGSLGPMSILWYGGQEVMKGNLSLGTLIAFNSFLAYLFGPAKRLLNINGQIQNSLASLERIFEFLGLPPEVSHKKLIRKLDMIKGKIEFQGVSFCYNDIDPVLKNIHFIANPGETTALVGRSGAGKTTLVHLIYNFFKPKRGKILLDGIDINEMDVRELRSLIGMVPQEGFLFSGTIWENIKCGNLNASEDEILNASRLAHVDEFVNKLTEGFDTIVGERGVKLSGGQRQRIALARVILRDTKILILDEPTSELDSLSEKYIQEALAEISKDKTIIVIAHRLSTIKGAHRIFYLENGYIRSAGTHEKLYRECESYRELYSTQLAPIEQVSDIEIIIRE